MENLNTSPRKFPLIIILIGTTLLAIPATYGTFALFDTSANGVNVKEFFGKVLLVISIGGFALFAGYILTAIFRRHSKIFWLCSALYNFGLSCCYVYIFLGEFSGVSDFSVANLINLYWLLPLWTIFVTFSSVYYLKYFLQPNKLNLS
jgi:hypothetical protein